METEKNEQKRGQIISIRAQKRKMSLHLTPSSMILSLKATFIISKKINK